MEQNEEKTEKQQETKGVEEYSQNSIWKSKCGKEIDSRLVQYMGSLAISLICLVFCVYQLTAGEDSSVYISIITMILGVYMPSPTFKKQGRR